MTISVLKAFLEGMDVQGHPTEDQWARIKEKIDALQAPLAIPDRIYYGEQPIGTWRAPLLDGWTTCLPS